MGRDPGPGVPEALPKTLRLIGEKLGADTLDQLWIFPPLVRGRKEWGLVAVSRLLARAAEGAGAEVDELEVEGTSGDSTDDAQEDGDARTLYTAVYAAERTGKGLTVEPALTEEGIAPQDRLPRVMNGVVRRSGGELGDPREVKLGGDIERYEHLLAEFESAVEPGPGEGFVS